MYIINYKTNSIWTFVYVCLYNVLMITINFFLAMYICVVVMYNFWIELGTNGQTRTTIVMCVLVSTIDYVTDIVVLYGWFSEGETVWALSMLACIIVSGIMSFVVSTYLDGLQWYSFLYLFGITQFEIFNFVGEKLDPVSVSRFNTLNMCSTIFEAFPSGALQLYVY
eukprot:UN33014